MFIEEYKTKAINSAIHPHRLGLRYVDETFVIKKAEHTPKSDGYNPFLDTLVHQEQTKLCFLQSTENLCIQTGTYIGPLTTAYLLSIVCLIPSQIGLKQFVSTLNYYTKKRNT